MVNLNSYYKFKNPQEGEEDILLKIVSYNEVTNRCYVREVGSELPIPPQELVDFDDLEPPSLVQISHEIWEEEHKPILDADGNPKRFDRVPDTAINDCLVWTELDCIDDEDTGDMLFVITNGYHYVNRSHHYICEVPYDGNSVIEAIDRFERGEDE